MIKNGFIGKYSKISVTQLALQLIGFILALVELIYMHIKYNDKLFNIDFYFEHIIKYPVVLFVTVIGLIIITRLIYSFMDYGDLDSLDDISIVKNLSIKNLITVIYVVNVIVVMPIVAYVCTTSLFFSVVGLYCKLISL